MSRDPSPSTPIMLGRALRRRCPRCGGKAFSSFFHLDEHCDRCGLGFEREEGYWVGALIINTIVTFGSFLVLFAGGMILFWPDVPWGALMAVTIGVNAVLPVIFYPFSKTIWLALELSWHPLEAEEVADAAGRIS
ncbi:MAG TPA: DUF983 domain-containing protein [Acidimicrobiia bacterium]|nr:DUF983 domain-containing protein [Acidimicrobiia bacterium]